MRAHTDGIRDPQIIPTGLARRVAASLQTASTDSLAAVLIRCAPDPACYEASVRGAPNGAASAGRMMIEKASLEVVAAIAGALHVELPSIARAWVQLAAREGVPIIAGWDRRHDSNQRCVKLYVNASDAAQTVRARIAGALVPDTAWGQEAPAVVGMNACADGTSEIKLYVQSADAVALASRLTSRAQQLAATARTERADAGGVLSYDAVAGELQPRAFFVALREPATNTDWTCLRTLPGYDPDTIEKLLPFPPAPPRSIGIALGDESWTVYCKPRNSLRAPEALEPAAVFRAGDVEVGVFVEPTQNAARAFRRTEHHAVSIRVRAGSPAPPALESLVDWFTDRVRAVEHAGGYGALRLSDPPAPWRNGTASEHAGERS